VAGTWLTSVLARISGIACLNEKEQDKDFKSRYNGILDSYKKSRVFSTSRRIPRVSLSREYS
jgi:hypothetical protein